LRSSQKTIQHKRLNPRQYSSILDQLYDESLTFTNPQRLHSQLTHEMLRQQTQWSSGRFGSYSCSS